MIEKMVINTWCDILPYGYRKKVNKCTATNAEQN